MKTFRLAGILVMSSAAAVGGPTACRAQCCLSDLFAGCGSCFRKAPAYAVAPVVAPVAAPIAAAPPPVMVPVQQTSYVPETTYRTQYQCVPVTTYKPSYEVDPCTGCTRECMQPVTQYVQQPVNVPVTQYRAVTTTKYVQMQPGYAAQGPAMPQGYPAPVAAPPATGAPAASPFAAPIQTTPQAWGAAGSDVPQQLIPGQPAMAPPALPPAGYSQPTFQQQPQPIVPQSGQFSPPPAATVQPQPAQPPALAPAPSLKPIPEMPRQAGGSAPAGPAPANGGGSFVPAPSLQPGVAAPVTTPPQPATSGTGMPTVPGSGRSGASGAFPKLLEPSSHTTSWQPAAFAPAYPTAALPAHLRQ